MKYHECARAGVDRPAVALCRYCSVGLCKDYLVEMHRSPAKPLYACPHRPEHGLDPLRPGSKDSMSSTPRRAA